MTADERIKAIAEFGFTQRQRASGAVMRHAGCASRAQYASFAGIANAARSANALSTSSSKRGYAVACDCVTTARGSSRPITSRSIAPLANLRVATVGRCPRPRGGASHEPRCGARQPQSRLAHDRAEKDAYVARQTASGA